MMPRGLLAALVIALAVAFAAAARQPPPVPPPSPQGERIYREGVLPDGGALRGRRADAPQASGKDAACVNCHGRSGMGVVEGRIVIPPITAAALFHPGERAEADAHEEHRLPTPRNRGAYDDETLARAIREGVGADGRTLDPVMPRFDLDPASMKALIAHLRQLSAGRTPGAVNDELHFATIVTPDADPVARDAMLEVLRAYFAMKDDFTHDDKSSAQKGPGQRYRMQRRWLLHVWQLSGAPDTWERQLDEKLHTQPVFAVISGIAGATWAPVHAFCEHQGVPCLFPNVDLPVVAESDFYPVYFSRGVLLEADLIATEFARRAAKRADAKPARIVQVFRGDDVGAAAAQALQRAMAASGVPVVDVALGPGDDAQALGRAASRAHAGDALVLWLRAGDLAQLPDGVAEAPVFVSGLMGGLEAAPLPPAWRASALMSYPYALPEERRVLANFPLGWLRAHHIPVVNARVQIDTYTACSILSENAISTHGTFLRDFLVERIEATVGSGMYSGGFKRLGLAPGQRFAAKGGYLVRFAKARGEDLIADGEWAAP